MTALRSVLAATVIAVAAAPAFAQAVAPSDTSEDVVLTADTLFENEDENTVIAEGNVEASYQGRVLKADRVVYDRNTNKVRASGNVVILDPDGSQRFADEIEVSSNLSDGYAVGFSLRLPNGGQAVANSAIREAGGLNALDQVVYTACEVCEADDNPTWALRARRAVLDEEDQMITYRDAVLEVFGFPVIYLPYFAHPDPQSERRSGLLFPDAGVSSKRGVFYQQPYYWAISPHSELIIAPEINGKVNPLLEVTYNKRFWSGELNFNGSITSEARFDGDGETIEGSEESVRGHVFASGLFAVNDTWDWGFGVEHAADSFYLQRYDLDGAGDVRGLYVGQARRLINQLYLTGQDEDFYSETAILSFQSIGTNGSNDFQPTVAPVMYSQRLFDFGQFGRASVTGSAAVLLRNNLADSQRVSLGADWERNFILPGGLVFEPFAELRGDYYGLDEEISGEDSVTRAVGSAGARLSYPLIRRGESVDVLVEPILMGAWGFSNANDPVIPNEDSLFFEVDTSSLFEASASSGYDLYEGDGRLAAGIRTSARWTNGVEISATAGRRWRSRSDPNFNTLSNLDGTSSDWVANTTIDLGRPLRLEANFRLDDEDLNVNRIDTRLTTNVWRLSGSLQYYRLEEGITTNGDRQEGIAVSTSVRLTDSFSISYSRLSDIADDFDQSESIGFSYSDDCAVFTIAYQRADSRSEELGESESINFRFTLRTLGEFGSADVD